jgi:hypothetical protein
MRNDEIPNASIVDEVVVLAKGDDGGDQAHREDSHQADTEGLLNTNVPEQLHGDGHKYDISNNIGYA